MIGIESFGAYIPFKTRRAVQDQLSTKRMINYQKYLRWREIIPVQPPSRPPMERPSAVALMEVFTRRHTFSEKLPLKPC